MAAFNMNVSINESRFMNNQATSEGGGALLTDKSGVTIIGQTFFNENSATSGCGGAVHAHSVNI